MRAVCIVFGVPPHYLTLSFLYDESQAQPQATELRKKGEGDVIGIQQQSGGDGGKRAVYFKMSLYHWLDLSEII